MGVVVNMSSIEKELAALKSSNTAGKILIGGDAKSQKIANTPNDGSNALLENDLVMWPTTEEDFDKAYFVFEADPTEDQKKRGQRGTLTAGVMCEVVRGGTLGADGSISGGEHVFVPIYANAFKRRVLMYNAPGADDDDSVITKPKGTFSDDNVCDWPGKVMDPAQDDVNAAKIFKKVTDDMYQAFKQFMGQIHKAINRRDPWTRGYRRGGGFRMKTQKMLDLKIVHQPTAPAASAES